MRKLEKFKKILHKLLLPRTAVVIVLVPIFAAMLICALAVPGANRVAAYVSHAVSVAVLCVKAPARWRSVRTLQTENKYVSRCITDVDLRMKIPCIAPSP